MNAAHALPSGAPTLGALLQGLVPVPPEWAALRPAALGEDSRTLAPGALFLARAGRQSDGLAHLAEALARGALAVVHERPATPAEQRAAAAAGVPLLHDPRLTEHLGEVAARWYGRPSARLDVIGVTGTDGKTSTSHFIAQALSGAGRRPGLIGTLGCGPWPGVLEPTGLTTPDAIGLQRRFAALAEAGCDSVAMEVSSIGLDQGRPNGTRFAAAVFTNLGRDHLDYHGDEARYAAAKRRLFDWPALPLAVLNTDDAHGRRWYAELAGRLRCLAYGVQALPGEGLRLLAATPRPDGWRLEVDDGAGTVTVELGLLGRFNVHNALAVAALLVGLGWPRARWRAALEGLRPVPGRMECFTDGRRRAVIDYAHTPQALAAAIEALRTHFDGRLIVVFGCGGDRDRGKRPQMGAIAEAGADRLILTDDNPRHEAPEAIVADILAGLRAPQRAAVIHDRAAAIAAALAEAGPGDTVLIAGKGHETDQQYGDVRRPFSDAARVRAVLEGGA
ncbi:MAG: UDP-N-acetylmuramoyl-L-alanyl-D-glutamate--2,6-diaminopimelate ligase [Gammaproteobacteria bacterium]|nr:MAG: UDP-N-acetylmuramoyl-L-alanyl-D-glutamate--2,6-diaminopimelate ligase [Gammaproteobacteria bacterium]